MFVEDLFVVVRGRARYEKKFFFCPKLYGNDTKWPENRLFQGFLQGFMIYFFLIWSKKKFMLLAKFLCKLHTCKNLVIDINDFLNQIAGFFKLEYLVNLRKYEHDILGRDIYSLRLQFDCFQRR